MAKKVIDKIAELVLSENIYEHEHNLCSCDLTEGGYGLCFAGQYLEGCLSSENILEDLG